MPPSRRGNHRDSAERESSRRGTTHKVCYAESEDDGDNNNNKTERKDDSSVDVMSVNSAELEQDEASDLEIMEDVRGRSRRSGRASRTSANYQESSEEDDGGEEEENDNDDLVVEETSVSANGRSSATTTTASTTAAAATTTAATKKADSESDASAAKSPASLSGQKRKIPCSKSSNGKKNSDDYNPDDDESTSTTSSTAKEEGNTAKEEPREMEPFKISKVLASRSETRAAWKEIVGDMNTSAVDFGSRWTLGDVVICDTNNDTDTTMEERFLIKWTDLSYMHCSWEIVADLLDLVEGSNSFISRFVTVNSDGLAFDANERCDGDYFDPGWAQVDRIMEVHFPEEYPFESVDNEDDVTNEDLGIVVERSDPGYESGLGRQLLIKWSNRPYSECSYEYERDLILRNIEYKDQLKSFVKRSTVADEVSAKQLRNTGEAELRRLYKEVFGERSETKLNGAVEKYQKALEAHEYPNGGKLRDYQAEGVAWMMSNFVNKRSSILADEMGLGKTIQLAALLDILARRLHRRGPFLIVVPLSTLCNWKRELDDWTDFNTIVYHGTAKNREMIRTQELSHAHDRPKFAPSNALYLRKCAKTHDTALGNPWMAEIVITTPELLCADDYAELTAVKWECLVVDEAHRLKNHSAKFAANLRDHRFVFAHKVLLTGTPIQNTMKELFALLNFVDPSLFGDCDEFLEKYGDMQSKDHVDELHEEIRPYILRRLKEDVEKSVPPKEETIIEVELTIAQKQYYRALYEKNVKFLHKNKKKPLDGPSLSNLAMQLRKCCNHLFLLNGIEEEFRKGQLSKGNPMSEGDLLVAASGKVLLLDKLLPRLKENGHRILIFSQFKIMLDVLEDYLLDREMTYERIDGSITGKQRQQAIDRFQAPGTANKEPPFAMLLSTRAGGVGINLTAADTCIIFDSDWNPQNDLQAQARCHRIGQTKDVKVYRLVTAKTYEMQMFHMSSLKLGLDQAVLSGFEAGSSGENALSKAEIERLLRHGAYSILSEDKDGTGDAASKAFAEENIDSILARRSRVVVYENTGSESAAKSGKFSKARFNSSAKAGDQAHDNIDVEDPDFWKKMLGEPIEEESEEFEVVPDKRTRTVNTYSEEIYDKKIRADLELDADAAAKDDAGKGDFDEDEEEFEQAEESESDDEDFDDYMERAFPTAGAKRPPTAGATAASAMPIEASNPTEQIAIESMSVSQIVSELANNGIATGHCLERIELTDALSRVRAISATARLLASGP